MCVVQFTSLYVYEIYCASKSCKIGVENAMLSETDAFTDGD